MDDLHRQPNQPLPLLDYRLVPGLDELETTSSKSDSSPSDGEDEENRSITPQNAHLTQPVTRFDGTLSLNSNSEDDEIGDGLRTFHQPQLQSKADQLDQTPGGSTSSQYTSSLLQSKAPTSGPVERRRRKLPEIPKNKKRKTHPIGWPINLLLSCEKSISIPPTLTHFQLPPFCS